MTRRVLTSGLYVVATVCLLGAQAVAYSPDSELGTVPETSTAPMIGVARIAASPLQSLIGSAPLGQEIVNGGFEDGSSGWGESSQLGYAVIMSDTVPQEFGYSTHGGTWLAWLGGDYNERAAIWQEVTIGAQNSTLRYWRWIDSFENSCDSDYARVLIDDTEVISYPLCITTSTEGWAEHRVDLSAHVGSEVTLGFLVETNDYWISSLFVDDVALVPPLEERAYLPAVLTQ